MARQRRRKQKQDPGSFFFIPAALIGGPIYLLYNGQTTLGWALIALEIVLVIVLARYYGPRARARRLLAREVEALNPYEFEAYVAAAFVERGWKARATKGSGDQGADVVAESPAGVRFVVQVKKYRKAVGNKAVQEIVAAKAMYRATQAIVVTSGPGYTRAAEELAQVNDVALWGLDDLRAVKEGRAVRPLEAGGRR